MSTKVRKGETDRKEERAKGAKGWGRIEKERSE